MINVLDKWTLSTNESSLTINNSFKIIQRISANLLMFGLVAALC